MTPQYLRNLQSEVGSGAASNVDSLDIACRSSGPVVRLEERVCVSAVVMSMKKLMGLT